MTSPYREPPGRLDILFIVTGLTLGGAESQVTELAIAHARAGRKIAVMSMVSNGDHLPRRLAEAGIPVIGLAMRRGRPSIAAFVRAAQVVRRLRPRVVHANMFHSNLLARMLRAVAPISALVCTAHNSNEGGPLNMVAYRLTHGAGDVLTNVSEVAARELERRGAAPAGTILSVWNGIDAERFRPDPERREMARRSLGLRESEFVFLAVGRLVPQKDYPTLLQAMSQVATAVCGSRLLIVGTGEQSEELKALSTRLNLSERVDWLGERLDPEALMNAADSFVLSSAYEGFGLVVAEAMASGLPVIATRSFGPEEVMGDTGILVPPRSPAALAHAMTEVTGWGLIQRQSAGTQARKRILERFSMAAATRAWLGVYERVGVRFGHPEG